jgi:HSP20 family protein
MATVLFDPFPSLRSRRPLTTPAPTWTPSVEVERAEDATTLRLDVPGVRPEDLEVSVVDHVLAIRGERRTGRGTLRFERRFALPEHVDADGLEAVHEHGVLELRVPIAKPERRVIPISIRTGEERHEAIEAEAAPEAEAI